MNSLYYLYEKHTHSMLATWGGHQCHRLELMWLESYSSLIQHSLSVGWSWTKLCHNVCQVLQPRCKKQPEGILKWHNQVKSREKQRARAMYEDSQIQKGVAKWGGAKSKGKEVKQIHGCVFVFFGLIPFL